MTEAAAEPAALPRAAPDGVVLRVVDRLAEGLVVAALLGELGIVLANVFARAYLHQSFRWADEVARLTLAILAFIGGAVATGAAITRPDLAPFGARMDPAYKRIADYASEANVRKFREMVEQRRKA